MNKYEHYEEDHTLYEAEQYGDYDQEYLLDCRERAADMRDN
jgi:hypothetical protein